MRDEIQPVYHRSLSEILAADLVCLSFNNGKAAAPTFYAGWSVWHWSEQEYSTPERRLNIWIRVGSVEAKFAAWWVDTRTLRMWKELVAPFGRDDASNAFQHFANALEKLSVLPLKGDSSQAARMRLKNIVDRVRCTPQEVWSYEAKSTESANMTAIIART